MEKSCGAVLFTRTDAGIRYLLVKTIAGEWGFAKGHMEGTETEQETALREIREEVALVPELLGGFRESISYPLPETHTVKQVVFFLGQYQGQQPRHQVEELLCCQLFSYQEALALLPYPSLREILCRAQQFLGTIS